MMTDTLNADSTGANPSVQPKTHADFSRERSERDAAMANNPPDSPKEQRNPDPHNPRTVDPKRPNEAPKTPEFNPNKGQPAA